MKIGFFEESEGIKSSTRLNSFILLFFLMAFDIILALTKEFSIDYNFILLNMILLLAVFTPKYLHKIAEMKFGNGNDKTNP